MKKTKIRQKESGITLIALVITIVVLLILAGVSINLVIGNQGILTRSKDAVDKYGTKAENEQQGLNDVESWLAEQFEGGPGTGGTKVIKVAVNTKAESNGTIDGKQPNINNPIIPEGYIPIDQGEATWGDGNSSPKQSSVDNGLVIKDESNNEWVWVPVEQEMLNQICGESAEGVELSGDLGVKTKFYTKPVTIGKEGDTVEIIRDLPNTGEYREPDIITNYDKDATYYSEKLGFKTAKELAEAYVQDYENMVKSIKKYGGFYIGRYELTEEGVKKGQETYRVRNWYDAYNLCKTVNKSNKVASRMVYSLQWDLTCDFISKKGERKNITDSSTWGNFLHSQGDAAVTVKENDQEVAMYGDKRVAGYSEYWKANNIYDFAGSLYECTQEAFMQDSHASRGDNYSYFCSSASAASQQSANVDSGYYAIWGTRPSLIVF